jgi:methionyl aminopeptidase
MQKDIPLKTSIDVARIRKSCRIAEETLYYLKDFICAGITTLELDHIAENFIKKKGAIPVLKGYKNYPASICTSVNNVVAHGIPNEYRLQKEDIITVDVTISLDGWHGDSAWTYIVEQKNADTYRLIKAAWKSTLSGILMIKSCGHIGDIGYAISHTAKKYGCSVIKDYVGHGIGEMMHEEPKIPNYGKRGTGLQIVPGMVFTVEPMVNLGKDDIKVLEDGWTIVTKDNSLSAQFEHTVAVFKDRIEILTFSKYKLSKYIDVPPFF